MCSCPLETCPETSICQDPNGKPPTLRWLWVALLPFVDMERLRRCFEKEVVPQLRADELERNRNKDPELVTANDCARLLTDTGARWVPIPTDWSVSRRPRPLT